MTRSGHYDDEIQDLLDGRLESAARQDVERHLSSCADCRRMADALRRVKENVRKALMAREAPRELPARVAAILDRETRQGRSPRRVRLALGIAAAAAVIAAGVWLSSRRDLPAAAAHDFTRYRSGALALQARTNDPAELERFFIDNGVAFPTRVFDLGMMNYRLVGGSVHTIAGRRSALFVYRGPDGKILVCEMYAGQTRDLPPGAGRREQKGIVFFLYRREGLTQVFWQEGDVTCVLTSDIPSEEVLSLAIAKAMKI